MRRTSTVWLAAALVACATKDASVDSTKGGQTSGPNAPHVVTVNAKDFAFTTGDTIQSGMTTFRLINGGRTLHHIVLARLDSGKTITDLGAALKAGQPPGWAVMIGGPNAPDPRGESNATLDVAPGSYALLCLIDIGGVQHFARGMIKALTVIPATGPAVAAPIADDSVTLTDYAFTLSRPLSSGHHTFRVVNTAGQRHELQLIKLAPGKTAKDLLDWIKSPKGRPPASAIGGISPGLPGGPLYFSADITPGNYFLVCFVRDEKDGKAHIDHGMSLTQTVQ